VERLERKLIADALAQTGGNQSAAARLLRVTERAVRYKVKKYGL
jgi:two-component system response regulator AtoC